jgi:hypothetical protein
MRAFRPDIVYCSVTGFGQGGPYAARPAYDFILQGLAGVMSTCGHGEGTAFVGACASVERRSSTGPRRCWARTAPRCWRRSCGWTTRGCGRFGNGRV